MSAVAVLAVAAVVATATGEGPEYERLRPSSVVVDPRAAETVDVELRIDPEHPDAPQIRVDGDGLIRIEVDSEQFCAPATGAAGGWIDVRLCAPVRVVTVTAYDIDDDVTSAVAEF